jgi:PmbA protein
LVDRLGSLVANPNVTLIDDPHMTGGLGSRLWGPEGITMKKRIIVDGGRLEQYFLDGYAARKLNTSPNGGHVSNFYLQNGSVTPADIIKSVKNGLFLTATSGHGFNIVTGDYSYGASGMWIENGELAYPVDKITVAGNMLDILNSIEAVGNDLEYRSSISAPTILIGSMSIGGT